MEPGRCERDQSKRDQPTQDRGHDVFPRAELRDHQRQEERGEGGVEAELLRVADRVAADRTDGRTEYPRRIQRERYADELVRVKGAIAARRQRPGLVDNTETVERAPQRRP